MKTKHFDIDHRKKAKRLKMDAEELMMESDGEEKESLDEEVEMNEAEEEMEEEEVEEKEVEEKDKDFGKRQLPSWKPDPSLPSGWKRRKVETQGRTIEQIISPDAKIFPSHRLALKHLIEKRAGEKEVELMRELLVSEGWEKGRGLPKGWRVKKGGGQSIEFITENCQVFKNCEDAIGHLKKQNPNDPGLLRSIEQYDVKMKKVDTVYEPDVDLPDGWTMRSFGDRIFFRTPKGKCIVGGRMALKEMIRLGGAGVEKFKKSQLMNGWKDSKLLPEGWMFRKIARKDGQAHHFLTEYGEYLKGRKIAGEVIQSRHPECVGKFQKFCELCTKDTRKAIYNWTDSDGSIPKGWKSRLGGSKTFFLSPDGLQFPNRVTILQNLIKTRSSKIDVEQMRQMVISHEGFKSSDLLPYGWMYKMDNRKSMNFLDEKGDWIRGNLNASIAMMNNPLYGANEEENLNKFSERICRENRIKQIQTPTQLSLPEGWKSTGSGGHEYVISPDGEKFGSSRMALVEMVKMGMDEEDLQKLRDSMTEWKQSNLLPKGWMYKTVERKKSNDREVFFLNEKGEWLRGRLGASKDMAANQVYGEEDLKSLDRLAAQLAAERRKKAVNWESVSEEQRETEKTTTLVLPNGWKSRMCGDREYVVSPEGEQFGSSRLALVEMVKREVAEEQLDALRSSMVEWTRSELLPKGWMYKKVERKDKTGSLIFLDEKGFWIRGRQRASKILEKSKSYGDKEIENLNKLSSKIAAQRRMEAIKETTKTLRLPEGWKSRIYGEKEYVLSPEGDQYGSGRLALAELVKRGTKEEDLKALRESMVEFKSSELLPKGWLYKISLSKSKYSIHFLDQKGNWVFGKLNASKILEKSSNYGERDMENLDKFAARICAERRQKQNGLSGSLVLPKGWKSHASGNHEYVISPEGEKFNSSRLALKAMISMGMDEDQLMKLKESMVDWNFSDLLPKDWMYKCMKRSSTHDSDIFFLDDTAELMRGGLSAFNVVDAKYGKAGTKNLEKLLTKISNERRMKESPVTKKTSLDLPVGWKSRVCGDREYVVSPEGEQYGSSRLALMELVRRGMDENVLEALRSSMVDWKRSELLPKGWMFRMVRRAKRDGGDKTHQIEFLDETGAWVRGRIAAKEKMRNGSPQQVQKLQDFFESCTVKARVEGYLWNCEDKTIPAGWKSRVVGEQGRTFYLSPEGQQFSSRLAILQHLIDKKGERGAIDRARRMVLEQDGWRESKFLPYKWIFKHTWTRSNKSKELLRALKILSEEGHFMDSYVAAKAYMEETNKYDQEDLKNIDAFVEENAKTARLEMQQKADEALPRGWRLIEVEASSSHLIVSPDGTEFPNRMLALQHMRRQNKFSKEDVVLMQGSLKEEGWGTSELLPEGWLFKKGKHGAGIQMFSNKGEHFESCTAAKQSLGEEDIKKMDKLINDTMTQRSKNKLSSQSYLPEGWQSRMEGNKEVFLGQQI